MDDGTKAKTVNVVTFLQFTLVGVSAIHNNLPIHLSLTMEAALINFLSVSFFCVLRNVGGFCISVWEIMSTITHTSNSYYSLVNKKIPLPLSSTSSAVSGAILIEFDFFCCLCFLFIPEWGGRWGEQHSEGFI